MANRYWVAGRTGNWNSTANWSSSATATTGGASVPGTADTAFFSANSGSGNCTVDINPTVLAVNMTGYTGTLTFNSAGNYITITGTGTPFIGSTSATIVRSGASLDGFNIVTAGTSTATKTITTGAVSETNALNFSIGGTGGGTYSLGSGTFGRLSISTDNTGQGATFTTLTVYGSFYRTPNAGGTSTGTINMYSNLSVAATSMLAGSTYTIKTAGTTNFMLYGATSNTPGTSFVATSTGTGTGTVTPTRFMYFANYTNLSFTFNIGTGSSQGSVALGTGLGVAPSFGNSYGSTAPLNMLSGYFYSNKVTMDFSYSASYFDFSPNYVKNIKIDSPITFGYTNQLRGNDNSGTTFDFSLADVTLYNSGDVTAMTLALPVYTKFKSLVIYIGGGSNFQLTINCQNLTVDTLDISQFTPFGGSNTNTLIFPYGSFIYVRNLKSRLSSNGSRVIIQSTANGAPFYLTKTGGGIAYFNGVAIKDCYVNPANTWYANTTSSTGKTENELINTQYFGNNRNNGNNSQIIFDRYPPVGGFNEFF
jgi:hypothetical protein